MRKNAPRKWLHAVLDLLPVILIPVFMIYSHRHTIDSGSIDVPQNQVVDFNQQFDFDTSRSWSMNPNVDSTFTYDVNSVVINTSSDDLMSVYTSFDFDDNSIYYFSCIASSTSGGSIEFGWHSGYYNGFTLVSNVPSKISNISYLTNESSVYLYIYNASSCIDLEISYINVINLTQMFGSGNEPTLQQFNEWYSDDYYDYTLSHKELLKGTSTITYQDTDIMSQVVYQLYNSVDKYFNMGNVFNMTGVYDWFNLNIFNGNAPISIYIVWNIVLYEFVMDLLFLLYGLFMWFIDMVEKLMEKPLKSVK